MTSPSARGALPAVDNRAPLVPTVLAVTAPAVVGIAVLGSPLAPGKASWGPTLAWEARPCGPLSRNGSLVPHLTPRCWQSGARMTFSFPLTSGLLVSRPRGCPTPARPIFKFPPWATNPPARQLLLWHRFWTIPTGLRQLFPPKMLPHAMHVALSPLPSRAPIRRLLLIRRLLPLIRWLMSPYCPLSFLDSWPTRRPRAPPNSCAGSLAIHCAARPGDLGSHSNGRTGSLAFSCTALPRACACCPHQSRGRTGSLAFFCTALPRACACCPHQSRGATSALEWLLAFRPCCQCYANRGLCQ